MAKNSAQILGTLYWRVDDPLEVGGLGQKNVGVRAHIWGCMNGA